MHPDYMTSKFALTQTTIQRIAVQHHHAHLAACLADNSYPGPVIGVIFDGTGYGLDGTIWGGEFLVGDASGFVRGGYLQPLPLPGGDAATQKPYRIAWAYWHYLLAEHPYPEALTWLPDTERCLLNAMVDQRINTPLTSSVGRLFDAISAMLGVCQVASYEAQAASELEAIADKQALTGMDYPFQSSPVNELQRWGTSTIQLEQGYVLKPALLLEALIGDVEHTTSQIAYRFHVTVARMITQVCIQLATDTGIKVAALSGGCFQNKLLLELTTQDLALAGFQVLVHHQVPCNDGGLSLGQAIIARATYQGS